MSQFHKLTINDITKETDACVTISFQVPSDLKTTFEFKAGQYITLKSTVNGKELRRDYSICSSPKSGILKVAVKAVVDGTFSQFANSQLQIGDVMEVSAPNGRFVFEPNSTISRTVAAFAAGSGITPVMSILKTVLEQEPNSNFVLVYGNKSPKDTIFLSELLQLQSQYQGRLKIHFVYSQSQEDKALFGRIEKSTVNFILKNDYRDTKFDRFYLCGPEPMIHLVKDVLLDYGIEESQILFELFTVATPTAPIDNDLIDGKTKVTILLDDEETTFVMDQKKSVLDAALAENLDAPYSCQGGICSSCLARLTEGEVTMRQNNILTDGELEEGLILTCQAHPTTPTIRVDYDDI
ncbi:ferredoxin--NADP reductase [Subsaxibacter sp. CAU 1640]|uniref:ferredoxin--NADP reductase n=1 Tax=Subsaxibacter sp. CAU 1640 TaxID=2933271 RepID=UPI00200693BA|nr:ferredoxin--NADP reductase [Subsaxibacter sp. CAU 1640]MCK7589547.1 ferredoxin--NADP reductase [Subsaxibacter sp. CAU 1640]